MNLESSPNNHNSSKQAPLLLVLKTKRILATWPRNYDLLYHEQETLKWDKNYDGA